MSNATYIEMFLLFFVYLLNNIYNTVLCNQTCICIIRVRHTRFYISNLQYNQYITLDLNCHILSLSD